MQQHPYGLEPDSELPDQLSRYIVDLSWLHAKGEPSDTVEDPKVVHATAFAISVRGYWLLVTAGHVIDLTP